MGHPPVPCRAVRPTRDRFVVRNTPGAVEGLLRHTGTCQMGQHGRRSAAETTRELGSTPPDGLALDTTVAA